MRHPWAVTRYIENWHHHSLHPTVELCAGVEVDDMHVKLPNTWVIARVAWLRHHLTLRSSFHVGSTNLCLYHSRSLRYNYSCLGTAKRLHFLFTEARRKSRIQPWVSAFAVNFGFSVIFAVKYTVAAPRHGMGRLDPTVKHTGQESGGELCSFLQILVVTSVKMCKQCLQTAPTSGNLVPRSSGL